MTRAAHLVSRFFGSLHPRALDAETVAWVERALEPSEFDVWERLGRADRAESVDVARRLDVALARTGEETDASWIAAALLHDVGKQASDYGPIGRSLVTVVATVAGAEVVRGWAHDAGPVRSRMARYAAHAEVGADLLRQAGARREAIAWAGAHHRPDRWDSTGIPPRACRALAVADGEPAA